MKEMSDNIVQIKNKIIGEYFREQRQRASLSQNYVASALGYNAAQMVSNWERGVCTPPYSALKKLMKLYGLSKSDVVEIMTKATREQIEAALK